MGEVVYRSQVTVTRHQGPLRIATVPAAHLRPAQAEVSRSGPSGC